MIKTEDTKPWYRQRWLWFVLSIPICSVILSSIMVFVAVKGKDSLVSDNYYKDGMEINQTIEQDIRARELGLRPSITLTEDGLALLRFQPDKLAPQPFVLLKIIHPTLSEKDISVKLLPTEQAYIGDIPAKLSGRHYLDIYAYDRSWRIRQEVHLPLKEHILSPAHSGESEK